MSEEMKDGAGVVINVEPRKTASSDDIRDRLAEMLLDIVTNGVKVKVTDPDGVSRVETVHPTASYLGVVVNYLKANPPMSVPTAGSASGILAKHAKVLNLPFAGKKTA